MLQEGHYILFLRLGQFDASRVLQSRVYRHRHESLPEACLVDHDSTQVVEILVEEFEVADYRSVYCSELEQFEMDQSDSPVNFVHHSYCGVVLLLSHVHSGNVELRIRRGWLLLECTQVSGPRRRRFVPCCAVCPEHRRTLSR